MIKKLWLILLFLLNTTGLFGLDQIIKEYPELSDFLNSSEFKKLTLGYPVEVTDKAQPSKIIAAMIIEVDSQGNVSKKIALNSFYINKELITAEEFKFILCHELGHLNDHHNHRIVLAIGTYCLYNAGLLSLTVKNLIRQEWQSALKNISIGALVSFLGYLSILKLFRNGEFFADRFAINITKNKDAAESLLHKRKSFIEKNRWIPNFLRNVLDDHPSEDQRIEHIKLCA